MPKKCRVSDCSSVYPDASFFVVPKSKKVRKLWEEGLGIPLTEQHVICEVHFKKEDLEKAKIFRRSDGVVLDVVPLQRARLKPGAVPCRHADLGKLTPSSSYTKNETSDISSSCVKNELFEDLYYQNIVISLPPSWSVIYPGNQQCVVFANFYFKEPHTIVPFKQVFVRENGDIIYSCYGKEVQPEFETSLTTTGALENTILKFNSLRVSEPMINK